MALKVMRVYGQPWHKSFYRFWYLGHKSKTYHRLWWLLGAVSLSPPGRQNYSIGCSSVLGAGRSSPRDRLISIANNKVYHVLHPHQKNTFFWHFTWILNYTVDCPSQHWMRKKISTLSSLKCLPDNWAKKNATEQARKASKHLTVLGHLDWATSVMLSLKQSQYIQQALKRKWLPSLTHLIYHSGSAKCPNTSWKLTIHQFLDLKHNHLALND